LLLYQPLHYMAVARFGEYYPALMMPQFGGTMTDAAGDSQVQTVEARVLFQDGSTDPLAVDRLVSAAPVSIRDSIVAYAFGLPIPTNSPPPSAPDLTHRIRETFFPGLLAKYRRNAQKEADPRTKDWLRSRISELYPLRKVRAVTFFWFRDAYRGGSSVSKSSREPTGAYEVSLEEGQ
jgi:hypothetical protein